MPCSNHHLRCIPQKTINAKERANLVKLQAGSTRDLKRPLVELGQLVGSIDRLQSFRNPAKGPKASADCSQALLLIQSSKQQARCTPDNAARELCEAFVERQKLSEG